MKKRSFGSALPPVSELSLGTWGLSGDGYGPVSDRVVDEVVQRARAYGITLFETCDAYGGGAMEKKLGLLLGDDPDAVLVTRVGTDLDSTPPRKRFDRHYLRQACERSAERLRRPTLDVVLLHNPSAETARESEASGALEELKSEGLVRAWGVSAGSAEVATLGIAHGAQVVELAYNVLYGTEFEGLSLDPAEVGVLARSVLAYGLLCGQWPETKTFPEGDHRAERWTQEQFRSRLRQLSVVSRVLGGDVVTLRAAALRFALASTAVSSAVIGPRSRVQLDQLVREAGHGPQYLEPAQIKRLKDDLSRMGVSR